MHDVDSVHNSDSPKASALAVGFNITNMIFGAGLLSLPWGMAGSGLVSGILVIFLGLFLTGSTTMIFIATAEKYKKFDVGGICREIPGRPGILLSMVANATVWASSFMCLISNTIIFSDSWHEIFGHVAGRSVWVLVAAAFQFPLSLLPQKYLGFASLVSIIMNVYLLIILIKNLGEHGPNREDVCLLGYGRGTIAMVCAFGMSAVLQFYAFPSYEQLENRSPRRFLNILMVSFTFVFCIFSCFTSIAYITYGEFVQSDIISALDNDIYGKTARVGISVVVTCCYPLMVAPMLDPIRELIEPQTLEKGYASLNSDVKDKSRWVYYKPIVVAMIVASSTVVTLFVDSLGFMNVLNGAISLLFFVCGLPAIFSLYLWNPPTCMRGIYYFLIFFGIVLAASGFVFTDNYHGEIMENCHWTF